MGSPYREKGWVLKFGDATTESCVYLIANALADQREKDSKIAGSFHDDDANSVDECECGACLAANAIRQGGTPVNK